ncbi:MAG: RICIN domain-containing protein [Firmicutes bacterium]|nr:RICIN domain-containing protein [Bacillota bacterium]
MKRKARFLSFILAFVMLVPLFTAYGFALEEDSETSSSDSATTENASVTWEDVIAGMATPDEYYEANNISEPISISNGLEDETSINSTYTVDEGTYYLNNRYTGKYLRYTSSSGALGSSGTLSSLGTSIQWEMVAASGGYYLRSVSDSTKYLGVPSGTTTSSSVEIVTVTSGSAPGRCLWAFSLSNVGGYILQNDYSDRYLYSSGESLYTKASLGSSGTSSYYNCVWRTTSTSSYSNTSSTSYRELPSSATFNEMIVSIGSTATPSIKKGSTTYMWSDPHDFTYTYSSGTKQCVTIASLTGIATGTKFGSTVFTVTHKVTGRTYTLTAWADRYYYELVNTFKLTTGNASTVRSFYSYVEAAYSSKSNAEIAYIYSRLLGGLYYDDSTLGMAWMMAAGTIYDSDEMTEVDYFTSVLGYGGSSYANLKDIVTKQHNNAQSLGGSDFAHFQMSLSGRLAYLLGKQLNGVLAYLQSEGIIASTISLTSEEISYLTGWLGDAILVIFDKSFAFKNDDYCADLDAENVYQRISSGSSIISSINTYYNKLSSGNRASMFLDYMDYPTVQSKVTTYMGSDISSIKTKYPDTYNFLYSLYNKQNEMKDYTS